jgi:ribonuclease HII
MIFPNFDIENSYNLKNIAGIDEAGRGPLCGDVFASCVLLNKNYVPSGINDSKKLNENKRKKIFEEIINLEKMGRIFFGVGCGSIEEIEKINIRNATKIAMQRSYLDFKQKYNNISIDLLLIDGNFISGANVKEDFIIKGDTKSLTIATASIIAKVSRDNYIIELGKKYPQYNWNKNKGYGTTKHIDAIKKYGLSPEHRASFCKKFVGLF